MTALITGASGAIGSMVINEFAENVVAFDVHKNRMLHDRDDVPFTVGDVTDLGAVIRALDEYAVDSVIHLAALLPTRCEADPVAAMKVNVGGTQTLLEAARIKGLRRVVLASSKAVYAPFEGLHAHPNYEPVPEGHPRMPASMYGVTKAVVEDLAAQYRALFGIPVVCFRLSFTYGPGKLQRHAGPTALLSSLVECARAGTPCRIARGGDQGDDFVYNGDVAKALRLLADAEEIGFDVVNIGSGQVTVMRVFIDALKRRFPSWECHIGPGLDFHGVGHHTYGVLDIGRIRSLGYEPLASVEAGIDAYIDRLVWMEDRSVALKASTARGSLDVPPSAEGRPSR